MQFHGTQVASGMSGSHPHRGIPQAGGYLNLQESYVETCVLQAENSGSDGQPVAHSPTCMRTGHAPRLVGRQPIVFF